MSKANTWETGVLNLLFNNIAFTLVGDASGLLASAAAGSLYLSLHTEDPGEAGDQTTSEVAYTSYARAAAARSAAGFTVSGNQVTLTANVDFPMCTGGIATATHVGVGTSSSGAGKLLYKGALSASISISTNVTPRLTPGTTITED